MDAALADLMRPSVRTARSSVIREILALTEGSAVLSLAGGMPSPETFPLAELAEAATRAVRDHGRVSLQYGRTEGLSPLRERLAAGHAARTGRPCGVDEVLVTAGSQQALDLLGRAFLDPGDEVAVETPGYLGAVQALGGASPRWLPVPVDPDGLRTDVLEDALRGGSRPKLVYTVADFQNPTGAVLHPDRRHHLADLAERWGFLVVEDDPYGRLRFGEPEHPPVASRTGNVVSLGTVSKTVAPGLRVGWVVAPGEVTAVLTRLKQSVDLHTSTLSQQIVLDLLGRPGWLDERATQLSAFYGERAGTLHAALAASVPAAEVVPARGGLFLWARLPRTDTTALLERAVANGVAFVPGAAFTIDAGPSDTLRLSFAMLDDAGLREAARRLGASL